MRRHGPDRVLVRGVAPTGDMIARDPDGALADEALYRLGIATYLLTHSNAAMYEVWDQLRERSPDSIWSRRIP